MQTSYKEKDTKNINVPLEIDLYNQLKDYEKTHNIKTHASFIDVALQLGGNPPPAYMEIILINDAPREEGKVLFKLNEVYYFWDGVKFIEVAPEQGDVIKEGVDA